MSDHETITEYERFINQVAADAHVTRAVLTSMLAKLAIVRGTELLDDVEQVARGALELGSPSAAANPMENRLHQLTLSRMDDYFRDLRAVVMAQRGEAPHSPSGPRGN